MQSILKSLELCTLLRTTPSIIKATILTKSLAFRRRPNNNVQKTSLSLEPWSSGYARRLVLERSWVRIPAPDTGLIFDNYLQYKIVLQLMPYMEDFKWHYLLHETFQLKVIVSSQSLFVWPLSIFVWASRQTTKNNSVNFVWKCSIIEM